MRSLLGRVILAVSFFLFITLSMSCHFLLVCKVSAEESAASLKGVLLYITSYFSLPAFNVLSLSLSFDILIIMCLGVGLFGFLLCGTVWASWIWMSVSFPRFKKFSVIISSHKISAPLSLSPPSGSPTMQILVQLILFHKSLKLSSLFKILFFFLLL